MKSYYFILIAVTFIVCGCSDDGGMTSLSNRGISHELYENVPVLDCAWAEDSVFKYMERSPLSSDSDIPVTRGISVQYMTVYGYTSYTSSGTTKAFLGEKLADSMGLPNQIYIADTIKPKYVLTVDGLDAGTTSFTSSKSPKCGLFPGWTQETLNERGYSLQIMGDKVTMETRLVHVISDIGGINYDKWFPCKPAELEWNYKLYIESED